MEHQNLASFIWSVADLLRGDFRQSEYGRIILPFTLLRRLECVLAPYRDEIMTEYQAFKDSGVDLDLVLCREGRYFYNLTPFTLASLGETDTKANLEAYINGFSKYAKEAFEQFSFFTWIDKLAAANLLYLVVQKFKDIDLHPETISNYEMGLVFEELIRRFAEAANDTAGEYFTPRDVVRLATTLVFAPDHEVLSGEGVIRTLYDPCCGTGGFLASGIEQVHEWNASAVIKPYGQELNAESYAIAMADMMIKGYDPSNIKLGNTLADDQLPLERFHYCLANPPFGVDWKKVQKEVEQEHREKGYKGRFGPGLPRVSDGSLLFLMHLLSKRMGDATGTRIGIILNGSPLFTGGAGSGESEIRRWILENDWLETIVALPTDLFYNTGIATYVWVLTNRKSPERKGKVQLVNAADLWTPMRKSLGSKRRYMSDEQIAEIARLVADMQEGERCKIFSTTDFGYRRITVERPLQLAFLPHDKDRLALLQEDTAWTKLAEERRQGLHKVLASLAERYLDREVFFKDVTKGLKAIGQDGLTAQEKKLL
ncbi:hypothetical protein SCACP_38570 [Sporomusa carbonis]|uniref:type I restriction-modification system subunit M n=1 Tax=Sporomusa carbonis TaxID=3076075 RepID=UPI003A6DC7ED